MSSKLEKIEVQINDSINAALRFFSNQGMLNSILNTIIDALSALDLTDSADFEKNSNKQVALQV